MLSWKFFVYFKCRVIFSQFRIIDDNSNKLLDRNEFSKGCRDFGAKLTKEEVEEIFSLIDRDGSGEIDFDEFLESLRVRALQKQRNKFVVSPYNLLEWRQSKNSGQAFFRIGRQSNTWLR